MYLRDIANLTQNRRNNQISFNLKARKLKKLGITPNELLNINFPKPIKQNIIKKEVKKNKIWISQKKEHKQ